MKGFHGSSRRHFIWLASMSSAVAAFGGLGRKSLAQQPSLAPKPINPKVLHLPQNTQLLLRDIKLANPNDPTALSKSRKIAPEELEAAFTKLNDAFLFDQSSGKLTRNSAVQLNADEEKTVQQLLDGYQRRLQAGEVKLRRGSNRLFIPLTTEPEEERRGSVKVISPDRVKSVEKPSQTMPVLVPESDNIHAIHADNYLLAAGCGWQWWRSYHWWGVRISFNKTAVNWIASGAAGASAVLAAMGITGWLAAVVGALAGILKAISNENGIRIYVTWVGASWATPKPTSSGGC
ncbi:MAG: hypothetical protein V7K25_02560 [Nostoc sp.]|uniref:hypothetical protein n=1 Tax=Nostoc sp. TaxID=1180 RepID=UPI002FF54C07